MILKEMARVCKPGGMVMAFAEPDYEARIAYPPELDSPVHLQTDELTDKASIRRQAGSFLLDGKCRLCKPRRRIHGFEWQGAI